MVSNLTFLGVLLTRQLPPSLACVRWTCSVVTTLADWPVVRLPECGATWCLQFVFPVELFPPGGVPLVIPGTCPRRGPLHSLSMVGTLPMVSGPSLARLGTLS